MFRRQCFQQVRLAPHRTALDVRFELYIYLSILKLFVWTSPCQFNSSNVSQQDVRETYLEEAGNVSLTLSYGT